MLCSKNNENKAEDETEEAERTRASRLRATARVGNGRHRKAISQKVMIRFVGLQCPSSCNIEKGLEGECGQAGRKHLSLQASEVVGKGGKAVARTWEICWR